MTTLPALRALDERLVKATGPDRELDAAIGVATGQFIPKFKGGEVYFCREESDGTINWPGQAPDMLVPLYTASTDAAILLCERMLPGWLWRIASCSVSDDAWVMPDFNHPEHGEKFKAQFPEDAQRDPLAFFGTDIDQRPPGFPALALCKSIIRALIAQAEAWI